MYVNGQPYICVKHAHLKLLMSFRFKHAAALLHTMLGVYVCVCVYMCVYVCVRAMYMERFSLLMPKCQSARPLT